MNTQSRSSKFTTAMIIIAIGLVCYVGYYTTHRQQNKVTAVVKPPEPVIVQWEIDKEFGDKTAKLANGLVITVYSEGKGKDQKWGWSVGGDSVNEKEAVEKAFKMSGIK